MKATRGRPRAIKTPEEMWDLFVAYKKKCKENPIKKQDYVGKDADEVYRLIERPLTREGFDCFVMENTALTYPDLTHYFNESKDFFQICSRITREIRSDQIDGGMAGIYNPSITQRLNSLVEKTETEAKVNTQTEIIIK